MRHVNVMLTAAVPPKQEKDDLQPQASPEGKSVALCGWEYTQWSAPSRCWSFRGTMSTVLTVFGRIVSTCRTKNGPVCFCPAEPGPPDRSDLAGAGEKGWRSREGGLHGRTLPRRRPERRPGRSDGERHTHQTSSNGSRWIRSYILQHRMVRTQHCKDELFYLTLLLSVIALNVFYFEVVLLSCLLSAIYQIIIPCNANKWKVYSVMQI